MNRNFKLLGLIAGLTVAACAAQAQEVKPVGIAIRLGLFFPTSDIAQNEGKNWIGGGIEYNLGDLGIGNSAYKGRYTLSADIFSKGDLRTVPVQINYIGQMQNFYYTAGAGVSFTRTMRGADTENSTELAYSVGIGREFKRGNMPFFVQLQWMGNGESDLNGWVILGGVRF